MQITGMLHGSTLLKFVGYPAAEVLGPGATEDEIKSLISRHGSVFGLQLPGFAPTTGRALAPALDERVELGVGDLSRVGPVAHEHGWSRHYAGPDP